jgi:hypothetical protein
VCPIRFPLADRVPLPSRGCTDDGYGFAGWNSQWIDFSSSGKPAGTVVRRVASPPSLLPMLLRKEVIQPHLPVRLPCYDFTPIADPTFDGSLRKGWATGFGCYQLSWCDGRCVQGPGTYSPQRC